MANAKKCDICKSFFEIDELHDLYVLPPYATRLNKATFIQFGCGNDENILKHIDLCPDCLSKFLSALENTISNVKDCIG